MKYPWHIWIGFVFCLAVVLAAMGWISLTALRADSAEAMARQRTAKAHRQVARAQKEQLAALRSQQDSPVTRTFLRVRELVYPGHPYAFNTQGSKKNVLSFGSKQLAALHQQLKAAAKEILESAIEEIENMPTIDTPAFQFERIRSLKYLRSTLKQVLEQKMSPLDQLKKQLDSAVEEENYELAAELRDKIRTLKKEFEL